MVVFPLTPSTWADADAVPVRMVSWPSSQQKADVRPQSPRVPPLQLPLPQQQKEAPNPLVAPATCGAAPPPRRRASSAATTPRGGDAGSATTTPRAGCSGSSTAGGSHSRRPSRDRLGSWAAREHFAHVCISESPGPGHYNLAANGSHSSRLRHATAAVMGTEPRRNSILSPRGERSPSPQAYDAIAGARAQRSCSPRAVFGTARRRPEEWLTTAGYNGPAPGDYAGDLTSSWTGSSRAGYAAHSLRAQSPRAALLQSKDLFVHDLRNTSPPIPRSRCGSTSKPSPGGGGGGSGYAHAKALYNEDGNISSAEVVWQVEMDNAWFDFDPAACRSLEASVLYELSAALRGSTLTSRC
eukprot:TRINITY_DN10069_c0_g1_i2.p1 TRINITY_DN10069_c0_g1~~TRINITY_DN10069_c0_g1_i2.p1  ORF type:complete len:355 (+),score=46.21 TRINITY_DN10069_c0_g1_i2:121-1185(+)